MLSVARELVAALLEANCATGAWTVTSLNETAQAAPGALGMANCNCRSLAMCNTPPSSSTT